MKKIVSLLLALVMVLTALSGLTMAADEFVKPDECSEAEAGVVVFLDGSEEKSYFKTLDNALLRWACQALDGQRVIALTKDLELTDEGLTEEHIGVLNPSATQGHWAATKSNRGKLTIDLQGHTLSYGGARPLVYVERYGFTFANGTIVYTGTTSMVKFSGPDHQVSTSSGSAVWITQLGLKNVKVYNMGPGPVVESYVYETSLKITDGSFVWSANGPVVSFGKSTQEKRGTNSSGEMFALYEGAYQPTLVVDSSTIGSGSTYAITDVEEGLTVTLQDCIFVSNATDGEVVAADFKGELDGGDDAVTDDAWKTTLHDGTEVTGKAFMYGDVVADEPLPFTDVPEGAWYYTYVKDLVKAGVVNGMTETTFAPEGNLTYGQALKLITLAVGEAEQAAVEGGHWASGYLALAKTKGWLAEDVNLNTNITRLALCKITAKALGVTAQPDVNPFSDCADTDVLALVKAGVINGMTETTFVPEGLLTRAQISKIIWTMGV